ncbi:MAG: hypothetical protein CSB24_02025 [Deltaproteobacteria bacterium]|nr:MAG: hypothetical protein CSB24_02025 [Deltaproteobacteria bacterium]
MPILLRDGMAVLFVHIPKCGGSSFLRGMANRGWREFLSIRGMAADQLGFMHCSPQHMHAEMLKQIVCPKRFDRIVTLVREPFFRLMSEYAWQQKQGITTLAPGIWIEHTLSEFSRNPFVCDNHIRPQNEFLLDNSLIFKLEDDGVNQALDTVSPLVKNGMALFFSVLKVSAKKCKQTKKSRQIMADFTSKQEQICDFYREDYERLGYPTPCP